MFIITLSNDYGQTYYLRNTVWAFSLDRAQQFATEQDARAALEKARKSMKRVHYKAAVIVPA